MIEETAQENKKSIYGPFLKSYSWDRTTLVQQLLAETLVRGARGWRDCRGEWADESPLPPRNLKIQKKEQKEKYITIYYTKIQDLRSCSRTGDVARP